MDACKCKILYFMFSYPVQYLSVIIVS